MTISWLGRWPRRFWLSYGLAVAAPLALIWGRMAMGYKPGDAPMLILFLTAPLLCAYFGGLGPGLAATFMGALVTDYFLLQPQNGFSALAALHSPQLVMFVLLGILISILMDFRRHIDLRHRSILEASLDAILVVNHEGRIEEFSPAAERMFGHTAAAVVGRELAEVIIPPAFRARHHERMTRFLATGETLIMGRRIEMTAQRADGTEFPVEVSILRVGTDSPPVFTGFVRDITERRRTEEVARLVHRQREELVNSIDGIVWEADAATFRFTFVSPRAERLLGYPVSRWIEEPAFWSEHIHPDDCAEAVRYCTQCTREKRNHEFEYRMVAADGRAVWLHDVVTVVVENDRPVKLRGLMVDITERKQAALALRTSEERYRTLFETMDEGFCVIEMIHDAAGKPVDYRFLEVNPAFIQQSGLTEALSKTMREMVPQHDEHWFEIYGKVARTGEAIRFENPATALQRDYDVFAFRIGGDGSQKVGVLFKDITENKQRTKQQLHAQRLSAVGTLASGLAHDLNNILAPVLMGAEVLKPKLPDPKDQKLLGMIAQSALRGADIISQLLTFSRGTEGVRGRIKLHSMLKEMGHIIQETFPRNIALRLEAPATLWPVHADATQLHQVIMNLCVNARDAMPDGGQLTLSGRNHVFGEADLRKNLEAHPGPYAVLTVSDTGHGIPPGILPRIFDPFFTTKSVGKGSGLGLSTSMGIIKSHGGIITVTSRPEGGTNFEIYLPATSEAADSLGDRGSLPPSLAAGVTVLVVDDEEYIRECMQQLLEHQHYRTLVATNGKEALEVYQANQSAIRLVITDRMMPGMDGMELARTLRSMDPTLRIIVCSGLPQAEHRAECAALGITEVLSKPFAAGAFLQAVNRVLDPKG